MFLLVYLHWTFPPFSWLGICCHDLQFKYNDVSNRKDVSPDTFPWPSCYFVWDYFVLGLCGLIIKACGTALITSSILVFTLIQCIDSHASILVFSMPTCLICSCFIALCCSDAGIIIPLPLVAIPSMIHHWMTISIAVLFIPQSLCMANCGVWGLSKHWGVHVLCQFPYVFCCHAVLYIFAWFYCSNGFIWFPTETLYNIWHLWWKKHRNKTANVWRNLPAFIAYPRPKLVYMV